MDEICRAAESTLEQLRTVSEQADGPLAVQSLSRRGMPTKGQDRPRSQSGKTARPAAQRTSDCGRCGLNHESGREACPAFGKTCAKCGKMNHYARKCRSQPSSEVSTMRKEYGEDQVMEEVYTSGRREGHPRILDPSEQVTLNVESGSLIRFQPDTGAQCSVLPVHIYKNPTGDDTLAIVTTHKSTIVVYAGSTLDVIGVTTLRVWRGDVSY